MLKKNEAKSLELAACKTLAWALWLISGIAVEPANHESNLHGRASLLTAQIRWSQPKHAQRKPVPESTLSSRSRLQGSAAPCSCLVSDHFFGQLTTGALWQMETTTRLALALALLPTVALSLQWLRNRAPPREIQNYRKEAAVAIRLARRCGRAMREADTKARTTIWKDGDGGIDPCTATDEANEKLVVEGLGAAFPTHRVVGEESCSANGVIPVLDDDDVPTWIVDPIDGTQNFVHGLPCSVVSIGMAVRGVPRLGVVLDPHRDELWVAAAGEGAYLNGRRLKVAAAPPSADLSAYTVLTDLGYERGPAAKPLARLYASLLDKNVRAVRILGSTVLNLCYVATGRASSMVIGLVERDCPKPWDWCAGTLVAREAGCTIEMVDGRRAPPGDPSKPPTSGEAFDLLSRSCVCAESPGLCTRLRGLARDAIAG